jgi:hypothetical protein
MGRSLFCLLLGAHLSSMDPEGERVAVKIVKVFTKQQVARTTLPYP